MDNCGSYEGFPVEDIISGGPQLWPFYLSRQIVCLLSILQFIPPWLKSNRDIFRRAYWGKMSLQGTAILRAGVSELNESSVKEMMHLKDS